MSKKSLNDLESLFREKIEEYQELPSDKTWQEIESKLDRDPYTIGKDNSFPKKWTLLSVLFIIGLVGCFIYYYPNLNAERRQANSSKAAQNQIGKTMPGNVALSTEQSVQEVVASANNKNKKVAGKSNVAEISLGELSRNNSELDSEAIKKEERKLNDKRKQPYKVNALPAKKRKIRSFSLAIRKKKALSIFSEIDTENGNKKANANADSFSKGNSILGEQPGKMPIDSLGEKNNYALKPLPQQNINSPIEKADTIEAFSSNKMPSADTIAEKFAFKQKDLVFKRHFSIAAVYAPNKIDNKLEQGVQRYKEDDKNVIEQQETIKSSFVYGVLAEYKFREHWAIQSGLKVSSTTTSIQSKNIFARPELATITSILSYKYNSTAGFTYIPNISGVLLALGDSVKTLPSVSKVNYAVVPLTLQYSTMGRLFFTGSAGVNINLLTRATLDTETDFFGFRFARTYSLQGLKKSYFSGSLGLGIGYNVSEKISVFFSPAQTFSFGPVNENTPVKKYERTIGYQAILRYRL
ncbi:outer membrane beta-barrel protein [Adhaeribacter aquaticus]|uniref:outer membrane beta-barrel protein n=1 Tax=Adhaeribacter aquaticus TaxID=299567 RepID=UPI0004194089|nr:outer membrane beta-barrel protein [Adhaeribacter aquaticus]